MEFFTSDHHFNHARIIEYANRPFSNVDEMDAEMIDRWNSVVGEYDTVYHLGDFTLGDRETAKRYFRQLNGRIRVLANFWHHDKKWLPNMVGFSEFVSKNDFLVEIRHPIVVLEFKKKHSQVIVLSHYPQLVWDRKHYGAIHLFGHSHGRTKGGPGSMDCGVDNAYKLLGEYRPFSLEEVVRRLVKR